MVNIAKKSGDARGEAMAFNAVTQAHMARWNASWEDAVANGMEPEYLSKEDPQEAIKAWTRARTLFRQVGDAKMELAVLKQVCEAYMGRNSFREATRMAEDALLLARKTKDKEEEAHGHLLCAQTYACAERFTPAIRSATTSKVLYQELGLADGREQAENYIEQLEQAQQEKEYYEQEQRQQRGGFGSGNRSNGRAGAGGGNPAGAGGKGRRDVGESDDRRPNALYNRKSFPWNPNQA